MSKRSMVLVIAAMLFLTSALFAQSDKKTKSKTEGKQVAAPEQMVSAAEAAKGGYVIGPEDVLKIDVWKEPEMSGTVPVRPDGKISLALLGDVQAAGLTPLELTTRLIDNLKKYLEDPRVTVTVQTVLSRRVFILGQVSRPGTFPLLSDMTVFQALSAAGGISEYAKGAKIYVLRTEGGKQVKLPFNYKAALRGNDPEKNFLLKPGDTIVVP
jgi:polysaccharide biosynthesis/export protein